MAENNELVRLLLLIVAIMVLLPVVMMVFAWPLMGMWGGGHMYDGGMWTGGGALMWLVPLVILSGGGYLLYRAVSHPDTTGMDGALEELRIAYAQGDLSHEEFEERRQRLQREEEP